MFCVPNCPLCIDIFNVNYSYFKILFFLKKLKWNILPKQHDFPSTRCTKKDTARSEQYLQGNCTEK